MTALAPEHLIDLKRSGLSDDTIDQLGFVAVRPHDLKHLRGVESAYALPYHGLTGEVNCATRWKVFPPITTPDGHTQKYYQAPGSAPALYLPPLIPWATVAKNPSSPLIVTEGEKKAAAMCQLGQSCAGVAGTYNWRQRLDNGERLTIPTLDQFIWQDRSVELVPDSDVWRADKQQALCGFFALGQELISRGASVTLVKLPERGAKVGLDDFLVSVGSDWEHQWPHLERLPLDDARLAPVAAWWQRWREKQATHAAIQQQTLDDLTIEEIAGLYTIHSPTHAVTMIFDRLTDARGGVTAEVTITLGATDVLSGVDVALKSDTSQTKLASSLKALTPTIPWKLLLQRACSVVLKRHREGEPLRILTVNTPVEPLTFQINPLVFRGKPTVLFGDGGLGKSSLALLCAMCVSTGETVAGIAALPGIPLYLDYEDSYDVHVRRMQAIASDHPTVAKADVRYQACTEPLSTLTHTLLRRIQADGITFLVLDSLAAATGGDAGAEAATKVFRALRTLNVGALVIAHVPKSPGEGQEPSIYGSVFHKNFARATWEIRKEQEIGSDQSILGIFNRKSNLSRLHPPIGLKVTQDADNTRMQYETFDLSQAGELATALPLPNRIRNLLESDGMPRPSKEIADELGAALPTVKAVLSKHKGFKWHMIGEGREAKWTVLNR